MIERRIIYRGDLINKLSAMTYEYIDELQMKGMFVTMGHTIQIEEEGDNNAVQTD